MKLTEYLKELLGELKDSRTIGNAKNLVQKMMEHQTTRLWTIADDKAEYERSRNLLNGQLKSVLDDEKISQALRKRSVAALGDKERLILLHDPCDIRKQHAEEMENLGIVRDLDGELISGYSTFNTVAVTPTGTELTLVDLTVYSNGDEHFVTQKELEAFQTGKMEQSTDETTYERAQQIAQYLAEDSNLNKVRVTREQLQRVHDAFKTASPEMTLCHVLDREFDGEPTFTFIDGELDDDFINRLKVSRNAPQTEEEIALQEESLKLKDMPLPHQHEQVLDKIRVKKRVYQQARLHLSWGQTEIAGGTYSLVRITLQDRHGKSLYKHPMMLLTNIVVQNKTIARAIYATYLMRAKIEAVFKFIKNALGWEQFQVRDFVSIKNIIALCFFVGGYFYEIEPALADNPAVALICQLGGGKGKITRHFFLEGIKTLLIFQTVNLFLQSNRVDETQFQNMADFFL